MLKKEILITILLLNQWLHLTTTLIEKEFLIHLLRIITKLTLVCYHLQFTSPKFHLQYSHQDQVTCHQVVVLDSHPQVASHLHQEQLEATSVQVYQTICRQVDNPVIQDSNQPIQCNSIHNLSTNNLQVVSLINHMTHMLLDMILQSLMIFNQSSTILRNFEE